MNMITNFIKDLGEAIIREITPGRKMQTINKEDFKENLLILIDRLKNLQNSINEFSPAERKSLADGIYKASSNAKNEACNFYIQIAKALNKADLRIAFDSFLFIAGQYVKTLEAIDRTTSQAFKDKAITVFNTKLSQVAIFGIIGEAELFCDVVTCLMNNITYELVENNGIKELPPQKPYRIRKVADNLEEFIDICKNRVANTSAQLAQEIDKIRTSQDVALVADDNSVNTGFIRTDKLTPIGRGLVASGARKFFIFRWLGEQWNLIKHQRYLKAKKEKEWMESHVALLKLQLQEVDPNSPEYRKQVKIIESYDEMIAELDQKIDAYLNDK